MIKVKYYTMFNMPNEPDALITLCDDPGVPMMFNSRIVAREYVVRNYKGAYNVITQRREVHNV